MHTLSQLNPVGLNEFFFHFLLYWTKIGKRKILFPTKICFFFTPVDAQRLDIPYTGAADFAKSEMSEKETLDRYSVVLEL